MKPKHLWMVVSGLLTLILSGSCELSAQRFGGGLVNAAGWLFIAGIIFFSGSLYLLSLSGIKILGAVAPIGGVCFLAGWACLAIAVWRS